VTRIRESIRIEAPAERVWRTVHEDLRNARKWTDHLRKVEIVGGGKPGKGSTVRYHLDLPGAVQVLEVYHQTWQPGKKCAGPFTDGPLKGTWAYLYREKDAVTTLTYEMDYELGGLLRFVGRAFQGAYEEGIRRNLKSLKTFVEARG
jgi:uncharacterized membrane protein